jgi:hypothetical protein
MKAVMGVPFGMVMSLPCMSRKSGAAGHTINAFLHAAGATVLAHENTKKRMSEPRDLEILYRGANGALAGLHFDPSPAEALPQQTFAANYKLQANDETLALQHFAPAHTDSDIYVHFQKAR